MNSKLTNHDRIAKVIEDAVVRGSGYAATEAANTIDEEFILIRKSDLPAVAPKPQVWGNLDVPMARTAGYRGLKPTLYWERALDFIAISLYAEQEVVKQKENELRGKREEAWKLLNPSAPTLWDYDTLNDDRRKQIDVVVNLMNQVDELKSTK